VWVEARLSISKVERFFFYLRVEMSVSAVNGYKNEEEDDEGKGCATGRMPRRRGHWILADAFVRDDSEEVVECLN
jgi:hypothetical protein